MVKTLMKLTVQQALMQGVAAQKEGKLHIAEHLYRAILQSQPYHPDANHNLGLIAIKVGMTFEALPLFRKALDSNPEIDQFWFSYIEALIKGQQVVLAKEIIQEANKYVADTYRLGELKNEINLQNVLDKSNLTPEKHTENLARPTQQQINILLTHYRSENFIDAEKIALSITRDYPKDQFAWKVLAAVLWRTGRLSEAVVANKTAVALLPNDAEAQNNLGNILKVMGKLEEAETCCRNAIALKFDFAEAHSNLGNTLKEMGRLDEAQASYRQAIVLNPHFSEAHNNLGALLQKLGRLAEAESSYDQAIKYNSSFASAYNNLGNVMHEMGRFAEAELSYKKAILLNSNYADALNNHGVTLQALGRLEEAEVSYKQAISINSNFVRAHSNLGVLLQELGRFAEAHTSYSQAIALKPDFIKAHNEMLTCLFLMDKKSLFYNELDLLIKKDISNSVIGSLAKRSALRYGEERVNTFCNEPLEHVIHVDLKSQLNFKEIFVLNAKNILNADKNMKRRQPLLSNGYQTSGNLFSIDNNYTNEIQKAIRLEIKRYKSFFENSDDIFFKKWPVEYGLYGWLINMKSGGELAPHIHENGWLSGSIYINVPPKNNIDDGNLVVALGKDNDVIDPSRNSKKVIDVVTGSMILFPASLMHHTIPFESEENRIVLAFDMIPINQ